MMYDLTFFQNGHFNQKNHVSCMPHAFNQSEYPFGQCGHFSQVEPFRKTMISYSAFYFCFFHKDNLLSVVQQGGKPCVSIVCFPIL